MSPTERPTPPLKKLHQLASGDVAEELARMDGEQLRKIAPQELDDGVWMKKDKVRLSGLYSFCSYINFCPQIYFIVYHFRGGTVVFHPVVSMGSEQINCAYI